MCDAGVKMEVLSVYSTCSPEGAVRKAALTGPGAFISKSISSLHLLLV